MLVKVDEMNSNLTKKVTKNKPKTIRVGSDKRARCINPNKRRKHKSNQNEEQMKENGKLYKFKQLFQTNDLLNETEVKVVKAI